MSNADVFVVSILLICNIAGYFLKRCKQFDNKLIPSCVGLLGAVLGLILHNVFPSFGIADAGTAFGLGLSAGLASTGAHQLIKQTFGKLIEEIEEEDDDVEK